VRCRFDVLGTAAHTPTHESPAYLALEQFDFHDLGFVPIEGGLQNGFRDRLINVAHVARETRGNETHLPEMESVMGVLWRVQVAIAVRKGLWYFAKGHKCRGRAANTFSTGAKGSVSESYRLRALGSGEVADMMIYFIFSTS